MSIFSQHSRHSSKRTLARGFTLIELLVVCIIIIIITTVLLLRQQSFDSSTLLRSLSYSVALSVRQAQVYGVSVFGAQGSSISQGTCGSGSGSYGNGACYASAYGLYFNTTGSYALFADLNTNSRYDSGEQLQLFALASGYIISEYCAISGSNTRCSGSDDSSGNASIASLTVLFKRPNPEAQFVALTPSGNPIPGDTYNSVYVQVSSAAGTYRFVKVTSAGQVSVCPAQSTLTSLLAGSAVC